MAPTIHQVLVDFEPDLAACIWHVWWPSPADPFYLHNPTPVHQRITDFYGINGTPTVKVDGALTPDPGSYSDMASAINSQLAISSPLMIDCAGEANADSCLVTVDLTVETPPAAGDYRLFVALVEEYIYFPSPNGELEHHYTFRWINNGNNATGEPIDLSTPGLQQFNYSFYRHPDYVQGEMGVTAWVQHYGTREVIQAGKASLLVPYVFGMSLTSQHTRIGGAGEPVSFSAEIINNGSATDTYDITVSGLPAGWAYSYTTPAGTFSGASTLTVGSGATAAIDLEIDSQGNPGSGSATLTAASQGDPARIASVEVHKLNGAQVLVIDDDGGGAREIAIGATLDEAGVVWGLWDIQWGDLTVDDIETAAPVAVWVAGDVLPSLTANDRTALAAFMDNGGKLLMTGQEVAFDLADPSSPNFSAETIIFFVNYLHANYVSTYSTSYFLSGVPGDPITDGLSFGLQPSGPTGQTNPDVVSPGYLADVIFTYDGTPSWAGGLKWTDGATHLVFLCFGLEGIYETDMRNETMARILEWFGVEPTGIGEPQGSAPALALAQNMPNPFRPSTTIAYRLDAAGPVSLRIYDVQGRVIRALVDGQQEAAVYRIDWNGRDDRGREVASGVYFYRLEVPGATATHRMVLTR